MNSPDNLLPSPIEAAAVPEVINHTAWPSQYFQMIDAADTIFHVMVSRITYDLKRLDADGYPQLADEQTALVASDEFIDAANISSVSQESDYAPFKPQCDLLFVNATAYAPNTNGKRTALTRFPAGVRVELSDGTTWQKLITATGPRTLGAAALGGFTLSEPEPALSVPVRYELAFGGTNQWWKGWPQAVDDDQRLDIDLHDAHNPIGCGLIDSQWRKKVKLTQFPAPQMEAFEQPFTREHAETSARQAGNPDAPPAYPAIGFGPIGRWWQPRRSKAGSYDEIWRATRWPKLPRDFDFAYWNAAPEDQQIDYPQGGEKVMLVNLVEPDAGSSADGSMWFRLPKQDLKLLIRLHVGAVLFAPMHIDTVIVDLANQQLVIVRRAVVSAKAEVRQLELGTWADGTRMETTGGAPHG